MKNNFLFTAILFVSISAVALLGTEKINNLAQTISYPGTSNYLPGDTMAVSPITNFNGVPGLCDSREVFLSWPTIAYATEYKIYRGDTIIYNGGNNSFIDKGLVPNEAFRYRLLAYNQMSASDASIYVVSPPPCQTPSGIPSTETSGYYLVVNSSQGQCGSNALHISWQALTGAVKYKVHRNGTLVYENTNLSFYNTGLTPGETYSFVVSAYGYNNTLLAKEDVRVPAPRLCSEVTEEKAPTGTVTETYIKTPIIQEYTTGIKEPLPTTIKTIYPALAPVQTRPVAPIYPTRTLASCNFEKEYLKKSTGACLPRSNCVDQKSQEYNSVECEDVRKYDLRLEVLTYRVIEKSVAVNILEISDVIKNTRSVTDNAIQTLQNLINDKVVNALEKVGSAGDVGKKVAIESLRDRLLSKVKDVLMFGTSVTEEDIRKLTEEIKLGLQEVNEKVFVNQAVTETTADLEKVLGDFDRTIKIQVEALKLTNGDLVFRDSNEDGISDYDAVHIFKMDPVKPSPVSDHEGRKIRAEEKVLLGFDPTKEELVKIQYEEPTYSPAPIIETYKIKEIKLNEQKRVTFRGEALPNSFVTLYIYSTPVIVTVKTDSTGLWQYTLDKELDNGEHVIYTASVDNSGKIIARSGGIAFVKTAEAVTIESLLLQDTAPNEPSLNLYAILAVFVSLILLAIIAVGYAGSRNKATDVTNQNTPRV